MEVSQVLPALVAREPESRRFPGGRRKSGNSCPSGFVVTNPNRGDATAKKQKMEIET
jgi:hypothetical protein